jgi:predicted TIM-barrel fold metal-dependent hydrolase
MEPRFKDRAPRFEAIDGSNIEGWQFEGKVSVDPDEDVVRHAIPVIGDDNIVISTDWPHDDSAYPRAIETFIAIEGVSDESKRKILWDNCARLHNLT